jgi:CBS domain-containing protein
LEDLMKANELMTPSPCCCSENDSAQDVARMMRDNDCGSVPVVNDSGGVVGIVTDRDLALRAIADGKDGSTKVRDLMTASPCCCDADDDVRDVERMMSEHQVRRIPIVDESGRCVGIVAQADLARAAADDRTITEHEIAIVVEKISEPGIRTAERGPGKQPEQRH